MPGRLQPRVAAGGGPSLHQDGGLHHRGNLLSRSGSVAQSWYQKPVQTGSGTNVWAQMFANGPPSTPDLIQCWPELAGREQSMLLPNTLSPTTLVAAFGRGRSPDA